MSLVGSLILGMIVLAGWPIVWVWRVTPRCGGMWPLDIAMASALFGLVFWAGPWVLVSYYLRFVVLAVFLLVCIRAVWMLRSGALRLPTQASQRWGLVWRASVLVAVAALDVEVLEGRSCPDGTVEVQFPFSAGTYAVLLWSPHSRADTSSRGVGVGCRRDARHTPPPAGRQSPLAHQGRPSPDDALGPLLGGV